ncbi:hypothetical protein [Streptomyces sp. S1]|uniref:hypothetical protein n=1 Tax=Streptomyces sp. S1 TaxID=718288 RepID=UPI003D724467
MRMAAVSAVAALSLGTGAGLAQASSAPVAVTQSVSVAEQADARQLARAVLDGAQGGRLSDVERAELERIAAGEAATASRWKAIKEAFSKVSGFGKAIAGKYSDFKAWYDGLSWWQKAPLRAITPGMALLDIYNMLRGM